MIIQIKAIWLPESRPAPPIVIAIELHRKVCEDFTITQQANNSSAFTFETLLT